MSEPQTATAEIMVHLVRPDDGTRSYQLPEGGTLADLLRRAEIATTDEAIFVDGLPIAEAWPLHDGAVVTILPRPRNRAGEEPWHAALPAFRDEDLYREYVEVLKTRRAEDPAS